MSEAERVETESGWAWREGNAIRFSASKTGESSGAYLFPSTEARDVIWGRMVQQVVTA